VLLLPSYLSDQLDIPEDDGFIQNVTCTVLGMRKPEATNELITIPSWVWTNQLVDVRIPRTEVTLI
jgi:hypothetical protein